MPNILTATVLGLALLSSTPGVGQDIAPKSQFSVPKDYDIDFVQTDQKYDIHFAGNKAQLAKFDSTLESEHFIIYYNGKSGDITPQEMVDKVSGYFEQSYKFYTEKMGIIIPLKGRIPVVMGDMGRQIGEASSQQLMNSYLIRIGIGNNANEEELQADVAHELFHIIQSTYFHMSDSFFLIESVPEAAAFSVFSKGKHLMRSLDSYFNNPDYFISGERNGTVALMIYLNKEYGLDFKRLLEAEASGYKDIDALRAVLAEKNVSFEEAYLNFVAYVYMNNFIGVDAFNTIRDRSMVLNAAWSGFSRVYDSNSNDRFYDRQVKQAGKRLNVFNKFGTDYLDITILSDDPFKIDIDNKSLYYSVIGVKKDGTSEIISNEVNDPSQYKKIVLAVTKLSNDKGKYSLTLTAN